MSDLHAQLHTAITARREMAQSAIEGPWRVEDGEDHWCLFGGADFRYQIIKAPKRGTPYAEYWPAAEDSAFIVANDPAQILRDTAADLRTLQRHVPSHNESSHTACVHCECSWPCPDYKDLASRYPEVADVQPNEEPDNDSTLRDHSDQ